MSFIGTLAWFLAGLPVVLSQCTTAICDSFDTYTGSLVSGRSYGPSRLNASISNYTAPTWAEIDPSLYWSPPSSLHINCTASTQMSATLNLVPNAAWPDVYGRTMFYYSNASGNDLPTTVHSWFFNAAGQNSYYATTNVPNTTAPSTKDVTMNLIVKDQVCLNYHWPTGEMTSCSKGPTPNVVANQWYCLQWHYDGPNNNAELWLDGKQLVSIVNRNTTNITYAPKNSSYWRFPDSGWTRMQFGFVHYQTLPAPVDVHLDDFVLDSAPTCCPCAAGVTLPHCCPRTPTAPTTRAPTVPPTTRAPTAPTTTRAPTAPTATRVPTSPTAPTAGPTSADDATTSSAGKLTVVAAALLLIIV